MQITKNKCILLIARKSPTHLLTNNSILIFFYLYDIFYLDNLFRKKATSCDYHVNPVDGYNSLLFL